MARPAAGALAALAGAFALHAVAPQAAYASHALVGLVLFCQFSATYVINDVFDITQDAVNHPDRALARGVVSRRMAFAAAMALFVASLVFAAGLGWAALAFTAANNVLFFAYSSLKRWHAITANFVASYFITATLLLGGIVGGAPSALVPVFLLLFAFVLGREIVCDVHDLPGDREAGLDTLPLRRGRAAAFRVTWSLLAAVCAGAIAWAALGPVRQPWLFVALVGAILGLYSVRLWRYQRRGCERSYRDVRAAGYVGLALAVPVLLAL